MVVVVVVVVLAFVSTGAAVSVVVFQSKLKHHSFRVA